MAPKAARLKPARNSDGDTDTDTDTDGDRETLRRPRQALKKRLSEVHNDHGTSRSVNMNDDAAEKRRRRKSNKLAVLESPQGGPSSKGQIAEQDQQPETSLMAAG